MMIRSMTGFGQAERSVQGCRIQIDMKSVNHRYHEVMVRMPREWLHLEEPLKKRVQQMVKRGRVDVFVTIDREPSAKVTVEIDWTLADGYIDAAKQLSDKYGLPGSLSLVELLRYPDLLGMKEPEMDGTAQEEAFLSCTDEALERLVSMRQAEGANLTHDLKQRLHTIKRTHDEITDHSPLVVEQYRTKLRGRILELLEDTGAFDEQRFAMEVALMAERTNIDEELTRLQSHLDQFEMALESDQPIGRKLDFLIQEMNREVNTMGSKSNDQRLTQHVVELKSELEKIREQVQNIE
jgi:uncharacterized protein (TIGR00255 family)